MVYLALELVGSWVELGFSVGMEAFGASLGAQVKASASNAGDTGLIPWVGKIPWRRKW